MSVLLLNALFRFGVKGDGERSKEEAASEYFSEHGEWPLDDDRPAGRTWHLPAGVVMPEDEETGTEPGRRLEPRP